MPCAPLTSWVTRRSTTTLASAERLASAEPVLAHHELEHPLDRERSRLVEILVEPEGQPGLGRPRDRPLEPQVVADRERELRPLDGASIASCETSPSPCAACPSPAERSAPLDGDRQVERRPGDELLAVDVPAARRGGAVEWMPGSSGGIPMTPRNGRERDLPCPSDRARRRRPRRASSRASTFSPSSTPRRSLSGVYQPPASVTPHVPMRTSSIRTSRVWPARAPRTSIGPMSACPASSSSPSGSAPRSARASRRASRR